MAGFIQDAEQALAGIGGLSDDQRRQYESEITAARSAAEQIATNEVTRITASLRDERDDLLAELCEVRDAATATRDHKELAALRQRHQRLAGRVVEVERLADRVEEIEADPLAYGEDVFNRHPLIRPRFSFI